jgi:hypothetical protein
MTDVWATYDTWAEQRFGAGISGEVMLATPLGFLPAHSLRVGDMLRCHGGPPTIITAIAPAENDGWLRIPALALGNRRAFVLGQGQGVLIESAFAQRIVGGASVVVPALALRGWHGVCSCPMPPRAVRLQTQRPALVHAASGAMVAIGGQGKVQSAAQDLPPVPSLSLASAQQMIACMIAYEAGVALRGLRPAAALI